ncbi:hypothetical protein HDU84_008480 [Entophlyctis sp. JEL0112]|nr:hypothetical protein HDU84_008480 [Entophlyctis sp. JEL0112]
MHPAGVCVSPASSVSPAASPGVSNSGSSRCSSCESDRAVVVAAATNGFLQPPQQRGRRKRHHAGAYGGRLQLQQPQARSSPAAAAPALYAGMSLVAKARAAVANAFAASGERLCRGDACYRVAAVIGFGTNGAVLAATTSATDSSQPRRAVAVKIIYRASKCEAAESALLPPPHEVQILHELRRHCLCDRVCSCGRVQFLDSWQDCYHYYLVTDLRGNNWGMPQSDSCEQMEIEITTPDACASREKGPPPQLLRLPFTSGCNDLFQWCYAYRTQRYTMHGDPTIAVGAVKSILRQVAVALRALHAAGYYHGDIKAENMLAEHVDGYDAASAPRVVLADFGHARRLSSSISRYGTAKAAGPEFLPGSPFAGVFLDGRAADVFALGMTAYVLMTEDSREPPIVKAIIAGGIGYWNIAWSRGGDFPFDGFLPNASREFWDLLLGMCKVDPRERFSLDQVLAHPWLSGI